MGASNSPKKSLAPTPAPSVESGGVDDEAISILMEFCRLTEKLALVAYPDPLSDDGRPFTIGYGSTVNFERKPWKLGDKITKEEAEALLPRDATEAYRPMATIPHWELMTAHQRAALADLNFNEGYTYGDGDHDTLDSILLSRNWAEVGKALQLYDDNDTLGLSRRRYAEWLMFYYATTPQNAFEKAWRMESVKDILRVIG